MVVVEESDTGLPFFKVYSAEAWIETLPQGDWIPSDTRPSFWSGIEPFLFGVLH